MYGLSIYGGLLYSNCDQMVLPPSLSPIPQFLEIVLERFIYSWQRYSVRVQPGAPGPHGFLVQCMSCSPGKHTGVAGGEGLLRPCVCVCVCGGGGGGGGEEGVLCVLGKRGEGRGCSDPVCVCVCVCVGRGEEGVLCVLGKRGEEEGLLCVTYVSVHRNLLQDDAFVDEIRVSIRYTAAALLRRAKKVFIVN